MFSDLDNTQFFIMLLIQIPFWVGIAWWWLGFEFALYVGAWIVYFPIDRFTTLGNIWAIILIGILIAFHLFGGGGGGPESGGMDGANY
ncbi:MAG: hypothetical protein HOE89_02200 [Gammaproteobacteria bacterium]|jgi:hypothetical protein|nr:hypothetical protein [Gammaproteobacteria bacterium]MBT4257507.1 hypothetical protein [Gammaproteobacteria bacterium]MBT4582887.1 hypothetical protein [Gammaproteobacteria bacterium]MBT4892322.1 hypothetical protein [Gammaproteobacteria bacterium]MBT5172348.1 hypothetical protein [Gammaproteobacteria bacterium]